LIVEYQLINISAIYMSNTAGVLLEAATPSLREYLGLPWWWDKWTK